MRLRSAKVVPARNLARNRPTIPYMGDREDRITQAWDRAMAGARADIPRSPSIALAIHKPIDTVQIMDSVEYHVADHLGRFAEAIEIPIARAVEAGAMHAGIESRRLTKARSGALRRIHSVFPKTTPTKDYPKMHTHAQRDHLHAAKKITADLVVHVSQTQRDGIREEIVRSVGEGKTVDDAGKRIATFVGLFPRWQNAVQNYRESMVGAGVNPKIADKRADLYSQSLVKKRGKMIARTELMRALNVGRNLGWQNRAAAGEIDPDLTTKTWQAAHDACDECKEMDGVEVTGLGAEFDTSMGTMSLPPMHPHCRCVCTYAPAKGDGVDRRVKTTGEGSVDDLADMDDLGVRELLDNL